jgi:hypothetical protein
MSIVQRGATLATAAAAMATFALTGCAASGTPPAGAGGTTSAAASAGPGSTASAAAASAASPSSGSSGGSRGSAAASGSAPRCTTSELSAALGRPRDTPSGQNTVSLIFTNTSAAPCHMYGFPGVDLTGHGVTWSLVRQVVQPRDVLLKPGGSSQSTLTFLQTKSGATGSFTPAQLEVTPPDEMAHFTLSWSPGVALVRQDEATHPGTFIGPVSSGG